MLTAAHCVAETGVEAVGRVFWLVMSAGEGDGEDGKEWWGWWKVGEEDGEEDEEGSGAKGGRGGLGREKERESSRSRIVGARCIAWDLGRDLALLKVTHAQQQPEACGFSSGRKTAGSNEINFSGKGKGIVSFPCVKLPPRHQPGSSPGPASGKKTWKEPPLNTPLVAIGHPADEHPDDPPGVKAVGSEHRRVLQLSSGRYLGIAPDKVSNPQDNSDTGAMQHDCWTYWGYSGGPIFERDSGVLVGVHVDWNPEEPLVKRAVPWCAVEGFLEENGFWS